jgi:hypothetical protein
VGGGHDLGEPSLPALPLPLGGDEGLGRLQDRGQGAEAPEVGSAVAGTGEPSGDLRQGQRLALEELAGGQAGVGDGADDQGGRALQELDDGYM